MIKVGAMSICLEPLLEGVEPTPERILHAAAEAGIEGGDDEGGLAGSAPSARRRYLSSSNAYASGRKPGKRSTAS